MKKILNRMGCSLVLAFLLLPAGCGRSGSDASKAVELGPTQRPAPVEEGERYLGEGFGLIVPMGWSNETKLAVGKRQLYLHKVDKANPVVDETGAPMQMGVMVDRIANEKTSLLEGTESFRTRIPADKAMTLVGEATTEPYELNDGTEAILLTMELLKAPGRRTLQLRLLAKDNSTNAWVVTGFIVTGTNSSFAKASSALAQKVRSHVTSFCLDQAKLVLP